MEARWNYLDAFKICPFRRQSKEQLFQEYVDQLTRKYWFRDRLVELTHRAAFNPLINIWKEEETTITRSSNIHVMDAMNLLASIHVGYELTKLERTVTDLEARLDRIEQGKSPRTPEET